METRTQPRNAALINSTPKKPFFKMALSRTHVEHPYRVLMPAKMLDYVLNNIRPMILKNGRDWYPGNFQGQFDRPRLDNNSWELFVKAYDLKQGDEIIFEVESVSEKMMWINVVIVRDEGGVPLRFQTPYDGDILGEIKQGDGLSPQSPIII